jgi:hypothetical protein
VVLYWANRAGVGLAASCATSGSNSAGIFICPSAPQGAQTCHLAALLRQCANQPAALVGAEQSGCWQRLQEAAGLARHSRSIRLLVCPTMRVSVHEQVHQVAKLEAAVEALFYRIFGRTERSNHAWLATRLQSALPSR